MRTTLVAALTLALVGTARAGGGTMVVAAETSADPVDAAVLKAVAQGVRGAVPRATVGDASLADSAFILGCDPAADACRDDVAKQLGVVRLVIVSRHGDTVEVVVRGGGGGASRQRFAVRGADDRDGLAAVERGVPVLVGGAVAPGAGDAASGGAGEGGALVAAGAAGSRRRTPRIAVALGIGGGVILGGGLALWGLAASTQADIDAAPTSTLADLQHLASLEDDGRRYAAIGNGLVIGGTLTAAAAVAWILWSRNHEAGPVRVAPVVGPDGASLHLEAAW